jgi:methyl-accepting chemotaxis protein
MTLLNCWDIKECGREKGGAHVSDLGECVASKEGLGHSCWAIAGTLCGGEVQGTVAQKEGNCILCDVFKLYNRRLGEKGKEVAKEYPQEEAAYNNLMLARLKTT